MFKNEKVFVEKEFRDKLEFIYLFNVVPRKFNLEQDLLEKRNPENNEHYIKVYSPNGSEQHSKLSYKLIDKGGFYRIKIGVPSIKDESNFYKFDFDVYLLAEKAALDLFGSVAYNWGYINSNTRIVKGRHTHRIPFPPLDERMIAKNAMFDMVASILDEEISN